MKILSVFWVIAFAFSVMALPEKNLTLKAAVDQALETNHEVKAARLALAESDSSFYQGIGSLFPSIGANLGYTYQKDALSSGRPLYNGDGYNWYKLDLSFSQPIYHGGALWYAIGTLNSTRDLKETLLKKTERDVTLKVIQNFYKLLLAKLELDTLQKTKALFLDTLKTARDRFRSGRARALEVLQIETELALIEPQILEVKTRLENQGLDFRNLMGLKHDAEVTLSGEIRPLAWNQVSEAEPKADLPERLEVRQVGVERNKLENEQGVLLSKHWPQLDVVGRWGRQGPTQNDIFDSDGTVWSIGVQLQIPLFSGLSSVFERRALARQRDQLDVSAVQTQDAVYLEQVQAQNDLKLKQSLLEAHKKALDSARESFKLAKRTYELGTETFLGFFQTQRSLLDAEIAFQRSQHDLMLSMANYFVAYGWSLENFVSKSGS